MSKKFIKRFRRAKSFEEWIESLKRFDYSLIKENNLQRCTMQDLKKYWAQYKGA